MSELPPFVLPPRLSLHDALPSGGHARGKPQPATEGGAPKKGQPWTEEEHRLFLLGLQQLGKGNWRGISRQFVTSRTPTQIASHAQKYSLRTSGVTKRRSRFSALEEQQAQLAAASSQGSSTHAAAQTAASSAQTLPLLASATSAAMMFAWPLLPPPPQGLQLGMLQGGALAPAPQPPAALSASRSSSTVGPTSQPSSPDSCTATGTSQEQRRQGPQQQQQQQQQLKQRSDGEPRPQHPRRVGVCRPTARLAGRRASCSGARASDAAGGQPPEQGGRVATPPTGGAGLQHSASSAFRALVSACGAAATCA